MHSGFKELDPDLVRKLLDEKDEKGNRIHEDIITPLVQKEATFFKNTACPSCGSYGVESFTNPSRPFSPGSPLPNKLLRCSACRTEFDPYTRLVTSVPTGASG
jgi:hypothetical protein